MSGAVHRVRILLLVFAVVLLSTAGVEAASVALVRPPRSSPPFTEALYRLQGELLSLGLDVRVLERPRNEETRASDPRAWPERIGTGARVDALLDLVGEEAPSAVDIWIFVKGGRTEVTRVTLPPDTANAAETLAIRAIEVLRSHFVEIDLAASERERAEPARAEPAGAEPAEPVQQPPPEALPSLGLQAGPAILTSLDGVGPALLPLLRVDWALSGRLVAQATFAGFGTRPTIETSAGSARMAHRYGVLGLCYCSPHASGFRPVVTLSAGVLHTSLDGRAELPERGHTVEQWSFVAEAGLGGRLSLDERYYVSLAGHVQVAEPYVEVHFVDELVASSGRPNLLATLTIGGWL